MPSCVPLVQPLWPACGQPGSTSSCLQLGLTWGSSWLCMMPLHALVSFCNLYRMALLQLVPYGPSATCTVWPLVCAQENLKECVAHIVENYSEILDAVDYCETGRMLRLKYEQVGLRSKMHTIAGLQRQGSVFQVKI